MDNFYVYEWIRLDTNEPFYVGKGKGNRWSVLNRGNNKHFNNIVKTIPVAVHMLEENLSDKVACEYECWYINEYKTLGYDIVNITDGGEGNSLTGKNNPMYGRVWWDENTSLEKIQKWREKLDKNRIGMTGKHHSIETKMKFSNQRKGRKLTDEWKSNISKNNQKVNYGKKLSENTKKKISENHADVSLGNNPRAIKVEIYDENMCLLKVADTVIQASEWLLENGYVNSINNGRSMINRRASF